MPVVGTFQADCATRDHLGGRAGALSCRIRRKINTELDADVRKALRRRKALVRHHGRSVATTLLRKIEPRPPGGSHLQVFEELDNRKADADL